MALTHGNDEYMLSLQIVPSDENSFSWTIVTTEHRDGHIIQSKEVSPATFVTVGEAEADGENQLLKMFEAHSAG
ncbi:hypothetical protein LT85_2927 [Collimonas arenae]|uniref:Uncharacterized protein n=1 Tax=Collimonas arenae TaxID=279058 RepID=A0A0A1FE55_9BURK|nr:hypothetical protein [Collimonas arenae]AIY42085.1 hypothetical protein LT85_2927 [Collimonas arenae]